MADDAQFLSVQGTRARDLVVDVQERFIKVATKTGQVILEGKLEEKVSWPSIKAKRVYMCQDLCLQVWIGEGLDARVHFSSTGKFYCGRH